MYKLQSGDINNDKYIAKLEGNSALIKEIRDGYNDDSHNIKNFLFMPMEENEYDVLSCVLTASNEFGVPLNYKMASLCYFILNANYAYYLGKSPMKITSWAHGTMLYDLYEGDYTKIDIEIGDDKVSPKFKKFFGNHVILFKEKDIFWEIPISFFKDAASGKTMCCLGGAQWATYAVARIGDISAKIPRSLWIKFYEQALTNGNYKSDNSDDIALAFDSTLIDQVYEVFGYMGLTLFKNIPAFENVEYFYDNDLDKGLCAIPLNLNAKYTDEENEYLWKKVNANTYHFLGRDVEYIPTKPMNGVIKIFK